MPEPFDPAKYGLGNPQPAAQFDPTKYGLGNAESATEAVNAQHPALSDEERGLIQNYAAGNPERMQSYLRQKGFQTQPEGNEIKIRLPGENQWHKVEEKSGFWDNVGRLASFATPEGFRDFVDYVALGRPMSGRHYDIKGELTNVNRAEALKDLTDVGGETFVGGAAALGALPGLGVTATAPLTGPLTAPVAGAGAAAATGGAYALGSGAQAVLSKIGEMYGLDPASVEEVAGQGALGAASVPIGEATVGLAKQAPSLVGSALKKPYQIYKGAQPKIQGALNEISGESAQEAEEQAAKAMAKETKDAAAKARMDELANRLGHKNTEREAAKQARLQKNARSAGERATAASASAVRAEDQRALSSMRDIDTQLRKNLAEATDQEVKKSLQVQIAKNKENIDAYKEWISQNRVRSAQSRESIAQRNAAEAKDAAAGTKPLAAPAPQATPSPVPTESPAQRLIRAKEEALQEAIERENERHAVSQAAANTRHEAAQIAAEAGGPAWDEFHMIARAAEDAAYGRRIELMNEAHESIVRKLREVGVPDDEAEQIALVIKDRAARAAPAAPTQTSVTPDSVKAIAHEAAEESTQKASRDLNLRISKALTPGLILRAGAEGTTGTMALAGHAIEKTPEYLKMLPMGARNLLEKLTAVDIPKEKVGELNISDPQVREAIDKILKRGAAAGVFGKAREEKRR
jgi:hypothetical protein